ncbi:hydrolase [Cryobacterium roopkundense]|uniref:Hydrolase n=1 Tax=Cryobacterium roopkundense TaxID=1001240 RepID=A0A099J592_9MICO|nr:HAD family hydrolase [Cryobacterium roopkundense]KGJ72652.1 hydrolase [Cryobacterium roopkundense]MBB5641220.1 HAD superfamily hydrolase (TIGR01509 family) [Cryobacterium roopkundense]
MNVFQKDSPLPAAVLWDMDGTLVDTEPYWMRAETELVASYGGVWTHDDCMLLVGSGLWNSASILQGRGVDMEADAIVQWLTDRVQEQLAEHGIPWRPGSRELLAELKDAGIPTALVTMSVKRMARQIVELIDFPAFDLIIAGDMVTNSKPHPEPYLTAAATLGVDPAHCVAIEDSTPGVTSAVAAGTITVAVPHQIDLPESAAYTRWSTLDGRTLEHVSELYRERLSRIDLDLLSEFSITTRTQ